MLYSKFGTPLTPISKSEDASGRVIVQATAAGSTDVRDYQIADLKADDGSAEINEVIQQLGSKVVENIPSARKRIAEIPKRDRQNEFRRRSN